MLIEDCAQHQFDNKCNLVLKNLVLKLIEKQILKVNYLRKLNQICRLIITIFYNLQPVFLIFVSYSRVRNKHTGTLINFCGFFQGLRLLIFDF